jgi:hypothetical protein
MKCGWAGKPDMAGVRLSRNLCAAVGSLMTGSHDTLNALFKSAGVPGEPPSLSHGTKWKEWLFAVNTAPEEDRLAILGNVIEERMDRPPADTDSRPDWDLKRQGVVDALDELGLQYFRGGRVLPTGEVPQQPAITLQAGPRKPASVEELFGIIIRGLPRAMQPLIHRRKDATTLSFRSEYDVQDLLHAMLRPWVQDIRPEEFTPSYAGTSTRMDFLLPKQRTVIEVKMVRDRAHARKIGDELTIDIDHYRAHPECDTLWCVIYDPDKHITNAPGLVSDLEGERSSPKGKVMVKVEIIT